MKIIKEENDEMFVSSNEENSVIPCFDAKGIDFLSFEMILFSIDVAMNNLKYFVRFSSVPIKIE